MFGDNSNIRVDHDFVRHLAYNGDMALLIDGYNLLHVTGIFAKGSGPGAFQRTREALLRFIAASIEEKQRKFTTVVFDATQAPPGLPSTAIHEEMTVRYAKNYPDADTLIEEIIENFHAPRSLLVVSSDHRIQRAARRRGSDYIDSDQWYELMQQRRQQTRRQQQVRQPEKPQGQLSQSETDYWLKEFADPQPGESAKPDIASDSKTSGHKSAQQDIENPFPPGYADDLIDDQ